MKHRLAALAACLMLLPTLAACSSGGGTDTPVTTPAVADTTAAPEETTTADPGRAGAKDNIPDSFTMNGATVGVYCRGDTIRPLDVDGGGEETGDIIFDAVYARTRAVEERLQLKFDITAVSGTWQEFGNGMQTNIAAGDDTWQIVFTTGNAAIQSSRDYLFVDLNGREYLDFTQPWWWTEAMEELSLDGSRIKYLVGDLCLLNYTKSGAVYFNKNLYTNNFGDADEMYKTVLAHEWTYDKMREICEAVYNDLNGNGVVDDGDLYGLIVDNAEYVKHMDYSMDVRRFVRDENGYPVVDYDVDRAAAAVEKLNTLLYSTTGTKYLNSAATSSLFTTDQTFFYAGRLEQAISALFREMPDDYGIIPYPMMDDSQTEYTGIIHNSSDYVTIPVTCQHIEEIGAVIEALCAESYRTVVETFYESALKMKYSRDALSGQCIDIIRDSCKKNFLYEYSGVVGCGLLISDQARAGTSNFASVYAKSAPATNKQIKALIEKYAKLEQQ